VERQLSRGGRGGGAHRLGPKAGKPEAAAAALQEDLPPWAVRQQMHAPDALAWAA
jgi:hypothetical protein